MYTDTCTGIYSDLFVQNTLEADHAMHLDLHVDIYVIGVYTHGRS
jgi:hypothetical protein